MSHHHFDLVIVGAGPAGLSAAGHAHEKGMDYVLLEKEDHLADTVFCYQKRKYVMSEPGLIELPMDSLPFQAGTREEVLKAWEQFAEGQAERQGLNIHKNQAMIGLVRTEKGFIVQTSTNEYETEKVILTIGTQGNPNILDVPGEKLRHVSNRLIDPDDFADQDIVVVGGGDAAIEVADALCERNRVSMVVRTPEFTRVKGALEKKILDRKRAGQITIYYGSVVKRIKPEYVKLKTPEKDILVPANHVILKIGTQPPRTFLESIGVQFPSKDREAKPIVDRYGASDIPGLFLVGSLNGQPLIKLCINQGYEVIEHLLGNEVEPTDEKILIEKLNFCEGTAQERILQVMQRVPLLAMANEEQLRELFLAATVKRYRNNDIIFRENDYDNSFFIIFEGEVGISVSKGNVEHEIARLTMGHFFGEMGLISGRLRSATVKSLGDICLIEIPRKPMLKLVYTAPTVRNIINQVYLIRAFQRYLFPQAPDDLLYELVTKASLEKLDRNIAVFHEGKPGDAFYLIRSGMVKISKMHGQKELVLAYLSSGNYFGEMALLSGAPRNATVTTIFPTELIRLSKEDFLGFLEKHNDLKAKVSEEAERRRIENLETEATPDAGRVLAGMIREEIVIGTDVLLIDEYKCVRCNNCVKACESVHPDRQARLALVGPKIDNLMVPNTCRHCENPLCMIDCPPDAITRRPNGEISIDEDKCIGCRNCETNCPYRVISMAKKSVVEKPEEKRTVAVKGDSIRNSLKDQPKERTVAVKCDLCQGVRGGPACVQSCPTGAAVRVRQEEGRQRIESLVHKGEG